MEKVVINSPLIEVVFEIRFKDFQVMDYDLLVGELYSKLKKSFPNKETLKPLEMPSILMPYLIQHRFRREIDGYPLYQLGPGIISFNIDGSGYNSSKWEGYKSELEIFLKCIREIMEDDFKEESIEHIQLRYVNKISDTEMYADLKKYFSDNLKLEINLNFLDIENGKHLDHTKLSQVYSDPEGKFSFKYNLFTRTEDVRKLILDISVETKKIPSFEGISGWLNVAHEEIEKFFFQITKNIKNIYK